MYEPNGPEEAERLCREAGNDALLANILHQKAITLSTHGDPKAALKVIGEAEQICQVLGEWRQLYHIQRSKMVFYADRKRSREALDEADRVVTAWLAEARKGNKPAELVEVLLLYAMRPSVVDEAIRAQLFSEALDVAKRNDLADRVQEISKLESMFRLVESSTISQPSASHGSPALLFGLGGARRAINWPLVIAVVGPVLGMIVLVLLPTLLHQAINWPLVIAGVVVVPVLLTYFLYR